MGTTTLMKGRLPMNSQKRILTIFFDLLEGKTLTKSELKETYETGDSTIQRDIRLINEMLNDQTYTEEDEIPVTQLERGRYQLSEGLKFHKLCFTDTELLAILAILLSSRALDREEMKPIVDKLIKSANDSKRLEELLKNEKIFYEGVPDHPVLDRIAFIADCVIEGNEIEFTYTKNGQTETLRRVPKAVYFSDLYFYMISAKETAQDDNDLLALNKFRINNMVDPQIVESQYPGYENWNERFEGSILRRQTNYPFFGKPIKLVIEFYHDPAYVLDRFPDSKIVEQKPGMCRIEMNVNDGYGMRMWLMSQGQMVKIIRPLYMKQYLLDEMKAALAHYDRTIVEQNTTENLRLL